MTTASKQYELKVSLSDFNTVLKNSRYGAKLGKRNIANEVVVLSFDGISLIVEIIGVTHKIAIVPTLQRGNASSGAPAPDR